MRHSEATNNISCENLFSLHISENTQEVDSEEEEEEGKEVGSGCGKAMMLPVCGRATSPPSSVYRKVIQESLDSGDGAQKSLTKAAYSYGTLPRVYGNKSCSLPGYTKPRCDHPSILAVMHISPEELASQITQLDFPVFRAICPEELASCGWMKKDKLKQSPNVVEFTRRFNHVNFWVVREILNAGGVKSRAEMMGHFIRVAKRLNELNNFHSQFAVVSALQSAPIYRLKKTWANLSRKERQLYERMAELFSEKNNWEVLRSHVSSFKLPMIPYLGMFLTDIVYIDMAHPHFGGLESEQRQLKMNNIFRILADCQESDYSFLPSIPSIQTYLKSVRYIEELQKFVEDDNYKLSIHLEPNTPASSQAASKDSVNEAAPHNISPAKMGAAAPPPVAYSCPAHGTRTKFVPGHRKARSLGTKFRSMSLPRNLHRCEPPSAGVDRLSIFKGCTSITPVESNSRSDSLSSLGGLHEPPVASAQGSSGSRHLLDDSEMDLPNTANSSGEFTSPPPGGLSRTLSGLSSDSEEVLLELSSEECGIQGALRRKTVVKDGKRRTVASWHRYWVQLWGTKLIYYRPKSLTSRDADRGDYKTSICKIQELSTDFGAYSVLEYEGRRTISDLFQLSDPTGSTVYKFRAPSLSAAQSWVAHLQTALASRRSPPPENLITFD